MPNGQATYSILYFHHQLSHQKMELMYKRGFSLFSLSHTKMNGYCHHYRQFLNLSELCHCWSNLNKFDVVCFNDNNACNNSCRSRQGTILHRASAMKWFHSPCHRDLQLFPSSFWSLFNFLCTCQYSSPSVDLLGTFNAYISL
jgi:hypothetical protein